MSNIEEAHSCHKFCTHCGDKLNGKEIESLEADNALLTAKVKELEFVIEHEANFIEKYGNVSDTRMSAKRLRNALTTNRGEE